MKNILNILKLTFQVLVCIIFLISCQQSTGKMAIVTPIITTTPSSRVSTETPTPIVFTKTPTLSPTKLEVTYELTYFSTCGDKSQCLTVIEIGCLDSLSPCIGQPHQLFKIPNSKDGPAYPIIDVSWSPDGEKIAVEAPGVNSGRDIFIGDWEGKVWFNLTNSPEMDISPVWEPGGKRISFLTKSPEYQFELFSTTLDGQDRKRLISSVEDLMYPTWSPDGKQIAFTGPTIQGQLFIADLDGNQIKQLTNRPENHADPQISPDGKWIVYRREPKYGEEISNLYVIQTDGTEERAITQGEDTWKVDPIWAPNGNWIAYMEMVRGDKEFTFNIFLIRPDGTRRTQVTNNTEKKLGFAWRKYIP